MIIYLYPQINPFAGYILGLGSLAGWSAPNQVEGKDVHESVDENFHFTV